MNQLKALEHSIIGQFLSVIRQGLRHQDGWYSYMVIYNGLLDSQTLTRPWLRKITTNPGLELSVSIAMRMNNQQASPYRNRLRCYAKSPTAQDVFRPHQLH